MAQTNAFTDELAAEVTARVRDHTAGDVTEGSHGDKLLRYYVGHPEDFRRGVEVRELTAHLKANVDGKLGVWEVEYRDDELKLSICRDDGMERSHFPDAEWTE